MMGALDSRVTDFRAHVTHAVDQLKAPKPRYGVLTRIVGLTIEARGITATLALYAAFSKARRW